MLTPAEQSFLAFSAFAGPGFAAAGWDEDKHPRGNTKNPGQFAPKGGGTAGPAAVEPQAPKDAAGGSKGLTTPAVPPRTAEGSKRTKGGASDDHAKAAEAIADVKPPPDLVQPHNDAEELWKHAMEAKVLYDRLVDEGQGMSKDLKARPYHDYEAAMADCASGKPGPVVILAALKDKHTATKKVQAKYGGNFERLSDIVRGTVAVDHAADIPKAIASLKKNAARMGFSIVELENKFARPTPAGYRDINLRVKGPNGHLCELQINAKAMITAKTHGHKLYEEARGIDRDAKIAGRPLTEHEASTVERLNQQMARLYSAAWEKSNGR